VSTWARPDDIIDCPTESQRILFGPTRRRVPRMIDLTNPVLLGPVQNQEHYMQGVVARRKQLHRANSFNSCRKRTRISENRRAVIMASLPSSRQKNADTVFVSLGSAAENIEAAVDYLRDRRNAKVGSIHLKRDPPPFPKLPSSRRWPANANVIILERTDEPMAGDNPMGRDIRTALTKALVAQGRPSDLALPSITPEQMPRLFSGIYGLGSRDFRPEHVIGAYEYATGTRARKDGKSAEDGVSFFCLRR